MKIQLTGQLMDAWLTDTGTLYLAFDSKTIDEQTLQELTRYQNQHIEATLSIDGKLPMSMTDPMGNES